MNGRCYRSLIAAATVLTGIGVPADAGIVGVIIGLLFLFWLFRLGLTAAKTENVYRRGVAIGALAGCFGILVHSIFDFVLHTTAVSVLFVTLMTLIVASQSRYEDDQELPEWLKRRKYSPALEPISGIRRTSSKNP